MKTVEIKCDACGEDLADAGAMPTYRLELSPQAVPNSGSIIYSMLIRLTHTGTCASIMGLSGQFRPAPVEG